MLIIEKHGKIKNKNVTFIVSVIYEKMMYLLGMHCPKHALAIKIWALLISISSININHN